MFVIALRLKLLGALACAVFAVLAGAAGASAAGLFSQMPGEMLEARFAPATATCPSGCAGWVCTCSAARRPGHHRPCRPVPAPDCC